MSPQISTSDLTNNDRTEDRRSLEADTSCNLNEARNSSQLRNGFEKDGLALSRLALTAASSLASPTAPTVSCVQQRLSSALDKYPKTMARTWWLIFASWE